MKKELIEKLNWQVWFCSNDRIQSRNVFNLSGNFIHSFETAVGNYDKAKDVDKFVEDVRNALLSAYWGKFEYEIILRQPFGKEYHKIDIYEQVAINWDKFIDYFLMTLQIKKGEKMK